MSIQLESNGGLLFVNGEAVAIYSKGMVMMFSGLIADIPEGWSLCDGTNGTPDLTNKFVRSVFNDADVGQTGGSADAVIVEHTHSVGTHTHQYSRTTDLTSYRSGGAYRASTIPLSGRSSPRAGTGSSTGDWVEVDLGAELIESKASTPSLSTVGEDGTDKNLPPFYNLLYIVKD